MSERLQFTPALRFHRPGEFQAVFDGAAFKVGEAGFLLLAKPNALPHPRLGLVVAKKKIRLAVNRNRIKRIVRDSFRLHQHDLPSLDIIFLVRQDLSTVANDEFHKQLLNAWKRLQRKARPPSDLGKEGGVKNS